MTAQIVLLTPPSADPAALAARLAPRLAAEPPAALLVRRHGAEDAAYRALVAALLPAAQAAGTAVLVEDDAALAAALGADGVHVSGGLAAVRAALAALKPGGIVGAGTPRSRHEAMSIGEAGVDYLFFGGLDAPADEAARELAAWWAETFEVPAVLSAAPGDDALGCEFIAFEAGLEETAP